MRIFTTLAPFADGLLSGSVASGSDLMRRVLDAGYDGIEVHLGILAHPLGSRLMDGLDHQRVTFHSNHHEFSLASANRYRRKAALLQFGKRMELEPASESVAVR